MVGGQGVLSRLRERVACRPSTRSNDTDPARRKWCRKAYVNEGGPRGSNRRSGNQRKLRKALPSPFDHKAHPAMETSDGCRSLVLVVAARGL